MKTKALVVAFGIVIVALFAILIFVPSKQGVVPPPGGAVPTSTAGIDTPEFPVSPDGRVTVSSPLAEETVVSPARVSGNVTGGGWFFEGSFPIQVVDADGTVLGQGTAQALTDWMSTGTVPFAASIPFIKPHSPTGSITLSKDNPSGLPLNSQSFRVPVNFGKAAPVGTGVVEGKVVLGPVCPVERIPPDPQCAPKPYQTSVAASKNIENPVPFETVQTDASGSFRFVLPSGEYDFFHPRGTSLLPRCEEKVITVEAGRTVSILLMCDTGIR